MGATGGIAPTPMYGSVLANAMQNGLGQLAAQQHLQQNWQAQAAQQWIAAQHSAVKANLPPAVVVIPLSEVSRTRIAKLLDQLPLRVVAGILRIEFYNTEPMRFVVTYANLRELEIYDIDAFPSDEHVARIVLDSP